VSRTGQARTGTERSLVFVAAEIIDRPYLFGFNLEPECSLRNRCHRVRKLLWRRDGEQAPFARQALEFVSAALLELES
jgi:hypothetical protein